MNDSVLWIKRVALSGACCAFVVILLGVATRLMDAGLGCPDWPGCYGEIIVPDADTAAEFSPQPLEPVKAWMEMIHRYVAAILGVFAIVMVLIAFRFRQQQPRLFYLVLALFLMVGLQGLFGMLTVTLKLWPVVVTLHLLGGLSCLGLFAWVGWYAGSLTAKNGQRAENKSAYYRFNPVYGFAILVLVIQIALGGWTSSNYAGVGCIGVPQCNGEWFPEADFSQGFHLSQEIGPDYLHGQLQADARTAIHLTHRVGALLLGGALLMLYFQQKKQPAEQGRIIRWVLLLYMA